MKYLNTLITGMGSYIPSEVVKNETFVKQDFYSEKQERLDGPGEEIISKFNEITGIRERRYLKKDQLVSDMAAEAAKKAIEDANIDPETIDQIICAHNFGDIHHGSTQTDILPSLASRVKYILNIKNPSCTAYDILFGCPGWVQGMIQADAFGKAGLGKRFLVIGAEALSRVTDPYDRDSMIYSDGAGAAIVETVEEDEKRGMLSSSMQTDTADEAYFLFMGKSNKPGYKPDTKYIKMFGRKIYEYAISNVPAAMKLALDRADLGISDVKKVLIHQANEKMDEAIVKRFYRLYKEKMPEKIMPMSIGLLGNSSVATVPTLYDKILRNDCPEHEINKDDILIFASVGAGMNINSFVYKK
ncbi:MULTISPECIES: 3-oxoacyl-ACP synthase III family protein [unclassified Lentimicrobium]|uniref:3-oxoacyl-ACP synthase III family protein n=1 Tax=unclassified Lentimicrobium TaxID=2677434 RepID=UPI0015524679|nr:MULTISPECIES: 3-oxoacyl-ACP synthase III family protein [unclassified Lentimicrobium]NPD45573.1 3-oxoacyl-ACP synthase III family protein [Lentimicrobium sp. S6]NPD83652.1 3-oxoacyl-ACP synthase III family protein [Lentimicrobium sp. L6]